MYMYVDMHISLDYIFLIPFSRQIYYKKNDHIHGSLCTLSTVMH
jgi:hypothetical protein